jgi:hypothetical protein
LAEGVRAGQERVDVDILGQRKVDTNGVEEGGEGRVVKLSQPIEMSELEVRIKKHLKLSQSESGTFISRHWDVSDLACSPSRISNHII